MNAEQQPTENVETDEFPPCPMHGEGFICDHDPDEDYEDVSI